MRSVGCGLLLLAIWIAPAVGQAPASESQPSLEEVRAAAGCDATLWAGSISDIKAADPEQDAGKLIARGYFPLISARRPVRIVRLSEWRLPQAPEAAASDPARKPPEVETLKIVEFQSETVLADVRCLLPFPATYIFQAPTFDDAKSDDLTKWCGRAIVALADDYAKRFNQRVVGDPGFPHKDVCAVAGQLNRDRQITDKPTPDLIPAAVPDITTAARFGLTDRVEKFIADGADLARLDIFGFDALQWAVLRGYRPVFDQLVTAGAPAGDVAFSSWRPSFCAALDAAVVHGRDEMVAPLVQPCGSHEKRVQLLSLAMAHRSQEVVRALLNSAPALSASEVGSALPAKAVSQPDNVRLILERAAAEPESAGESWKGVLRSVLRWALAARKLDVVEMLLDKDVDPGPEALHQAIKWRDENIVRALARHGADVNRGDHPLSQPTALTNFAADPLGRAALPSQPGDARASANLPIFLVLMDASMVRVLLDLGADPNVRDSGGRTPLMVAIADSQIYGRKDGVGWIEWSVPRHLIKGQEDWEHRGVDPVRALLAKGADVALFDQDGLTALHYAARSDYNVELAQILLEHGADIKARDASGKTPLDHARAAKLVYMPKILAAAGAIQ